MTQMVPVAIAHIIPRKMVCFFFLQTFLWLGQLRDYFEPCHWVVLIIWLLSHWFLSVCYLCCHLREDMISRCDILGTDLRNVFYGYHNKIYPEESESEGLWLTYWSLEVCSLFSFFLIQIVDVLFLKWHYLRSVCNQMATFWVLSAFT